MIPFKVSKNRRSFFTVTESDDNYGTTVGHLEKYIFPPKFDFVTNETVRPILMYVFEFSTAISQKDITDMWQNLPPDVGEKFEEKQVVIEEEALLDSLYGESSEIQWMVFKVKKRAEKDFEKVRRRLVSDDVSAFKQTVGNYSYNWPYDYFSLVELVKIDETVQYASQDVLGPIETTTVEPTTTRAPSTAPTTTRVQTEEPITTRAPATTTTTTRAAPTATTRAATTTTRSTSRSRSRKK